MVAPLAGIVVHWHLAGLEHAGPRGTTADALADRLQGTAAAAGSAHETVGDALRAAREAARPGDRIVVFGSFHTASAALGLLAAD